MFAVTVKQKYRKRICTNGLIWVKDCHYEFYVCKRDRGVWETREDAGQMITEPWETVIEVPNA
jgi:hypothetical protein